MGKLKHRIIPRRFDRLHKVMRHLGVCPEGNLMFQPLGFGPIVFHLRVRQIPIQVSYDGSKTVVATMKQPLTGRVIRGVSKCHAEDDFDFEHGVKLAVARSLGRCFESLERDSLSSLRRSMRRLEAFKDECLSAVDPSAGFWLDSEKAERSPRKLMDEMARLEVLGVA